MFRTSGTPDHLRAYGILSALLAKQSNENVHCIEKVNLLASFLLILTFRERQPCQGLVLHVLKTLTAGQCGIIKDRHPDRSLDYQSSR